MDTKKLHTYASLAEVVAALAVIISLLYAGYEFRRTSTLSNREADGILFERVGEANRMLIESPGIAEITVTAAHDADVVQLRGKAEAGIRMVGEPTTFHRSRLPRSR